MISGQNSGPGKVAPFVAAEQGRKGKTKFPTFEQLNDEQQRLLNLSAMARVSSTACQTSKRLAF
jgi:hypothetical protein